MISLDDFKRLDLRVGEIVSAERIAGSARLLRVDVDLGTERRVVVAGLGRYYAPESHPRRAVRGDTAPPPARAPHPSCSL